MYPFDASEVEAAIAALLDENHDTIVIHSNICSFGYIENPLKTIAESVCKAASPDRTVLLPTFTPSFCRTGWFDREETPSETGALSEHFRNLPNAVRTPCPINSFAVFGPDAGAFMEYEASATCWGPGSIYEEIYNKNALIVGLGEPLALTASIFHHAEELVGVPYRFFKTFSGHVNADELVTSVSKRLYVRRLDLPVEYSYRVATDRLKEAGKLCRVPLGTSFVEAFSAKEGVDTLMEILHNDPLATLTNREIYLTANAQRSSVFLGSTNLELTGKTFAREFERLTGEDCRFVKTEFGRFRQEILDPESQLRTANPDYVVFLERAEEVLGSQMEGSFNGDGELRAEIESRVKHYLQTIREARSALSGTFFVANLQFLTSSPFGNADATFAAGDASVLDIANSILREAVQELEDTYILDFCQVARRFGTERVHPGKYWYVGRIPFCKEFTIELAEVLTGMALAAEEKTIRLIVVDLDQTLWGGVVGEDGVEGIALGGDFPGNVYSDIQRYLKALTKRGIALAVCSKNTEEIALKTIRTHPEMILDESDFVEMRINWKDKATNIRSISQALSLRPASVMFIDDNPIEREWVRRNISECTVPELPKDPAEWVGFLSKLPCLQTVRITSEDLGRTKQYVGRKKAKDFEMTCESIDEFLSELKMCVYLEKLNEFNVSRVCQLLTKTNQFNTTTKRYRKSNLRLLIESQDAEVFAVGLEDGFTEREIIGVFILVPTEETLLIDSFLLSCRVLGRNVESALLGWISTHAINKLDSMTKCNTWT